MTKTEKLTSLSIFMPAYNEEKNIANTTAEAIAAAKRLSNKFEVIIVNDGSSDNTAKKVKQLQSKHKEVRLVSHKTNLGYGAAVKTGLKSCKMEWIFFTDSDGQFKFEEMDKFVQARNKADLIVGYRKKRMDPFHRIFIAQVMLKLWNRVLFGLKIKDVDCAYKLFPRSILANIDLKTESAITVTELIVKATKANLTLYQIPVTHYPREHGTQTGGNFGVIKKAAIESFRLFNEIRKPITKTNVLLLGILLVAIFARFYRLPATITFLEDEGRDLLVAKKMIDTSRPIALGPQTSTGNMYLGPLYYYLITPALLLSNFQPIGPVVLIALSGIITTYLLYRWTSRSFGTRAGLLAASLFSIMPSAVYMNRNSWNPNLMPLISILTLFVAQQIIVEKKLTKKNALLLGILASALIQLHYMVLVLFVPLGLSYLKAHLPHIKKLIINLLITAVGFAIPLSPYIAFEFTNDFVNTHAITRYIKSEDQPNIRYTAPVSHLLNRAEISSTRLLSSLFGRGSVALDPYAKQITYAFIILVALAILIQRKNREGQLVIWLLFGSLLVSGLFQEQVHLHYLGFLFPLVYILAAYIATGPKNLLRIFSLIFVIASLIYAVPQTFSYISSGSTNQVIRPIEVAKYISSLSDGEPYNVVSDSSTQSSPYQYFLSLVDNPPSNDLQEKLYVICQDNPCDESEINNKLIFIRGPSHPSLTNYLYHPLYNYFGNKIDIVSNEHIIQGVWVAETHILPK